MAPLVAGMTALQEGKTRTGDSDVRAGLAARGSARRVLLGEMRVPRPPTTGGAAPLHAVNPIERCGSVSRGRKSRARTVRVAVP